MSEALQLSCSLAAAPSRLNHVWEHTIGSGHAPLALRADWQDQLRICRDQLGTRYVRFHALLSDRMGTLTCQQNGLLYSFFNADRIFDFLLSIGMRPFVELSFMPDTLASGDTRVFSYAANVTPPRDYGEWSAFIRKAVGHWADRYGTDEVARWYFEVWNEPNLGAFWTGTRDDYFNLYRHTARAIKSVDSAFRVGGPATAKNAWIPEFVDFCERNDLPADFISTHYYPTDALGSAATDTRAQLTGAPHGVMRRRAVEARRESGGRPLLYTEWSITSNPRDPLHDQPFAAALATNILMSVDDLVEAYSWWTFSDIFEENYFPFQPFHGGFGLLNLYGVPKPSFRAFELLRSLGAHRLPVDGAARTVSAWVCPRAGAVDVLLTNQAMPEHAIEPETVELTLSDAPVPRGATVRRVDDRHANPREYWVESGEPEYLDARQVEALREASRVTAEPLPVWHHAGTSRCSLTLPPQSLALVTLVQDTPDPAA